MKPLLLLLALVLIVSVASGQTALTTAQVAKRVSPSVVVIQGNTDSGDVLGSGFVVSKDGKIVTNLHVIRDMKTASVQLANGETFDSVSVLAVDERRDLAIVKVAGFDLPVLALGNSDALTVGELLVIVGSPRGLEGTVTAGILSSVRDSGEGFKVLQTDAAVNPGNSGGPLLNNKGQPIGVVSFKLRSAEGLNFAIPINYVHGLLNNLHEPMTLEQMRRGLGTTSSPTQRDSSAPSLKETLDWLKGKLSLGGTEYVISRNGTLFHRTVQVKAWDLTSCTVSVGRVTIDTSTALGVDTYTDRYTLPLGKVADTSVLYLPNAMLSGGTLISGERFVYNLLLTTNSKEIVWLSVLERLRDGATDQRTSSTDKFHLEFSDESIANRIHEAFRHAANLCRGKEAF